jgi:zinc protease
MKSILTCLLVACITTAIAQAGKPYDMMVNGVKVIVVPSGNEIVQINLVIKGGVQNYPANKAGIESLAITALTECGTEKDSKNSFKNKLDAVDAKVSGYASMDASHFTLNCIKSDFETAWPLYVDALTVPLFDAKEFTRIKDKAINNLRLEASNPDASLRRMAMQTAFKGMDYAKSPQGTIANLQLLTPAATKAYFKSILTKSRIFIVLVADMTKEEVEKTLMPLATKIPQGEPFTLKRNTYMPPANTFVATPKELSTNYVMGISGAPAANSPEYFPAQLASELMYNKIFLEVRTKQGLSYAPGAWISEGLTPYSVMYVSTKEPDKFIAVARNMVDSVKKNGFPEDAIKNTKNTYTTYQYYDNETNSSMAYMVASSEVTQGDWHRAFTLKEDLAPIKAEDVNKVFNKYIGNFTWVYQGDKTKVNPTLYTQKQTPPPLKKESAPVIMGKIPGKQ